MMLRTLQSSDLVYDFLRSPSVMVSSALLLLFAAAAAFPSVFAPHNVFDLASVDFSDAFRPPAWMPGGTLGMPLGADDQGRDVLSAIIYGLRISLFISISAVLVGLVAGIGLGLLAGFYGGWVDALIMRTADVQLTFPAVLVAVIVDGIVRAWFGQTVHDRFAALVIIVAIALSSWVQYARLVRASTMVEAGRDYVLAAQVIGRPTRAILLQHILPNVMTPVLVAATIQFAVAIVLEATLSFVGLGIPPTEPSLGTLIRVGNGFLMSGEWWLAIFPGLALLILVVAINLVGDFLRDALNPKLT